MQYVIVKLQRAVALPHCCFATLQVLADDKSAQCIPSAEKDT